MAKTTLHVLSPVDLVPGAVDPSGRTVETVAIINGQRLILVSVEFTNGSAATYVWPSATGWTSPAGHESVVHPAPPEASS